MAANKKFKRLVITTGDQDGVGLEVSAKALKHLGPQRGCRFFLYTQKNSASTKHLQQIKKRFSIVEATSLQQALNRHSLAGNTLVHIQSDKAPPLWIEEAAKYGKAKKIDALITAPLSKTLIQKEGLADIGHTDILARITKSPDLFMTFLGPHFNVLLATGHIPLSAVPKALNKKQITKAITLAHHFLTATKIKKPVGLVGLNPHAGEAGLLGDFESKHLSPLVKTLNKKGFNLSSPLVPDAAFLKANWKKYGIFVSLYHDQGLIAFKTAHQHAAGCHLTMGLPFIRTSVEHGTAKDIFNQNKANDSSMRDAILTAVKLAKMNFTPKA